MGTLRNLWKTASRIDSTDSLVTATSLAHQLLVRIDVTSNLGNVSETKVMTAHHVRDDDLRRVRGEYTEMPGLRLTTAQAQRLWNLDRAACDALLGALVDSKFLFRTRDGAFVRSEHARIAS